MNNANDGKNDLDSRHPEFICVIISIINIVMISIISTSIDIIACIMYNEISVFINTIIMQIIMQMGERVLKLTET